MSLFLFALAQSPRGYSQVVTNQDEILSVIELIGTAEKEIVPDEIYIFITLMERFDGKNKITIESQEQALRQGIADLNIPLDNLFLADANSNYVSVKWQKKDVIAKTNYTLKVSNAVLVGQVFELLDKLQIQNAQISHVNHSRLEELKKDVRIEAIEMAKQKADYLLEAIGQKTGKALYVREDNYHMPVARYVNNVQEYVPIGYNASKSEDVQDMPMIQFKKIKISSSVYVRFLIE